MKGGKLQRGALLFRILLRHWSMSLRSHVRYARETRAVTCKRTFEVVARGRFVYGEIN